MRDPFRITATYTYLRATEWNPEALSVPSTRRTVPLNPRHTSGIVASIEHDPKRSLSKPYLLEGFVVNGGVRLGF